MSQLEITESSILKMPKDKEENEIGVIYENKDYTKIPIEQINLNTEPISIINNFSQSFINNNIKAYIKAIFGLLVFIIVIVLISFLASHFHY